MPFVTERYLPITRNPGLAGDDINLPPAMTVSVTDPQGKRQRNFEGPLPDVLFGPAFSWFVSERLHDLLQEVAPGAVRFEKVALVWGPDRPCEGDWYLVVFQQYADVILEDRSNLLSLFERYTSEDDSPPDVAPLLYAFRKSVQGLAFWTGVPVNRDAPSNAASAGFTYCSDIVMDRMVAEKITGFGPYAEITLIDDDDATTIAPHAPQIAQASATDTGKMFHAIDVPTAHFGGVTKTPDDDAITLRVPTSEVLPDMWMMERLLVVSSRAKAVFEANAAADCLFHAVTCAPDENGQTYADALYVLTPRANMRPYILEQSSGISPGLLPDGQLRLKAVGADLVVDADKVGDCAFWDSTAPGTGPPTFVCAAPLMQALMAADVSGFTAEHDYPSRCYR